MKHRQDFWNDEIKRFRILSLHKAAKQWQEINFSRAIQINHRFAKIQEAFIYLKKQKPNQTKPKQKPPQGHLGGSVG